MKLGGLEDADEHGDIASPSADDLYSPARPLGRKDGVFLPAAIADVPEEITARAASAPFHGSWPRWIGQVCR